MYLARVMPVVFFFWLANGCGGAGESGTRAGEGCGEVGSAGSRADEGSRGSGFGPMVG